MVVMSDSTVFVRDSIIANGNTDDGNGAVFAQDSAKINLKSTVFSRNIQKGTFNDVFVVEFGSAFVDCDATARVFFCNGFDGITSNAAFTNCAQNGIDDATAPECAIA